MSTMDKYNDLDNNYNMARGEKIETVVRTEGKVDKMAKSPSRGYISTDKENADRKKRGAAYLKQKEVDAKKGKNAHAEYDKLQKRNAQYNRKR